jgi:hypothetical protein
MAVRREGGGFDTGGGKGVSRGAGLMNPSVSQISGPAWALQGGWRTGGGSISSRRKINQGFELLVGGAALGHQHRNPYGDKQKS